ncbi:hypothetical protein C0J52_07868 [Blattella germanica]|nr:hypothetical protein C0J52_07868 [Blattella germanica]
MVYNKDSTKSTDNVLTENNSSHSDDSDSELEIKQNLVIPGKPKSGRIWKHPKKSVKTCEGTFKSTKRGQKARKQEERLRRQANLKSQEENRKKSDFVQVVVSNRNFLQIFIHYKNSRLKAFKREKRLFETRVKTCEGTFKSTKRGQKGRKQEERLRRQVNLKRQEENRKKSDFVQWFVVSI